VSERVLEKEDSEMSDKSSEKSEASAVEEDDFELPSL